MRIWPVKALSEGEAVISGSDAKHIITVLRKKSGDRLKISSQDGKVFDAVVDRISENSVLVTPIGEVQINPQGKPEISLALGISKPSVMEIVVQKGVELGCNRIFLFAAERSISPALSPQKMTRLEKVAHEALKQCGRADAMEISAVSLEELPEAGLKIVLWEGERENDLKSVLDGAKYSETVLALIGPPAGLSDKEVEKLRKAGFISAGLGSLVLRTETAAIAMLSILNFHFGRISQ
ncbi:MAG: 16S rRNA (uracil(1498)-N(3))-methyltransferase [Nitrospinota bacterium]|nr:16S rRNA (uracil(1498)-N(3))-methyltransferase [Nitrospinota bacterium]